jgi:ketosteroid isomerase-like protein
MRRVLSKGLDEHRRACELFSTSEAPIVLDDDMEVTAGGDVAFVTARMHCDGGGKDSSPGLPP